MEPRTFPDSIDNKFFTQVIKETVRGGALRDPILINEEELAGDVKVQDSLII